MTEYVRMKSTAKIAHYPLVLVACILAFSSLLLSAHAASKEALIYCIPTAPAGFDGARYAGADAKDASSFTIFNRLVKLDPKTGRVLPESIAQRADYISKIEAVKHPMAHGLSAREGIEH